MKIDRIARLLEAFSSSSATNKPQNVTESGQQGAAPANSGAVALAPTLTAKSSETNRQDRVAEIKAQVSNGTYRPDSMAVAKAVARELLA